MARQKKKARRKVVAKKARAAKQPKRAKSRARKTVAKSSASARTKPRTRTRTATRAKPRAKAGAARPRKPAKATRAPRSGGGAASIGDSVALAPAGAAPASSRLDALQDKLKALEQLEAALSARQTSSAADDDEINPSLDAIANAKRVVEAKIAAARTGVLAPPSEADVSKLRDAIRNSENVIASNASVNQLARAATALIKAFS